MKLTKLLLVLTAFTSLVVFSDTAARAASPQTKSFVVQANVISDCQIDAQSVMDFGNYDPLSSTDDLTATGSVTITCTKGATVKIGLTGGANFANATNNMNGPGTSGTEVLAYKLYQPNGTTQWSDSIALDGTIGGLGTVLQVTGNGQTANPKYTITGKLVHGQNVSVGAYSDTVYAVVNF